MTRIFIILSAEKQENDEMFIKWRQSWISRMGFQEKVEFSRGRFWNKRVFGVENGVRG